MRTCRVCKTEKDDSHFGVNRAMKDGVDRLCRECKSIKKKKYHLEHGDRVREYGRRWRIENVEHRREYDKAHNKRRKLDGTFRRHYEAVGRGKALEKLYGITVERYDDMYRSQNGCCAICGKINLNGKRLAVDHNHSTGTVRGLLCMGCNHGIGMFHDDPECLIRAANYIELHKTKASIGELK